MKGTFELIALLIHSVRLSDTKPTACHPQGRIGIRRKSGSEAAMRDCREAADKMRSWLQSDEVSVLGYVVEVDSEIRG